MSGKYILNADHSVTLIEDVHEWARAFERTDRRVAETDLGPIKVSTVFLMLDHSFGDGPPVLFETMIFGGACDGEQERYSTWDEAVAGHARTVERVQQVGL